MRPHLPAPNLSVVGKRPVVALINLSGLTLGLTIYVFGAVWVNYQNNHDHLFEHRARIFIVSSIFAPEAGRNIREFASVRPAYGPIFSQEIKPLEQVARAVHRVRVLSAGDLHQVQGIRFVDPGFTRIFNFNYLSGGPTALDTTTGLILTASTARKLFGHTDVLGEKVSLEHQYALSVTAVIEDPPVDTHFNASFIPHFELTAVVPLAALAATEDFQMAGDWDTLLATDMTYLMLPEHLDRDWLQARVDAVAAEFAPPRESRTVSALKVRPLAQANTVVWDALGFPVLEAVRLLSLFILLIACVNMTNLTAAQSLDRVHEVALRKTFGAQRPQLMGQFLAESLMFALVAVLPALAALELLIPAYNHLTGHALALNYAMVGPRLVVAATVTGLLAGLWPAYLVTRAVPRNNVRQVYLNGTGRFGLRAFTITIQFTTAIAMTAMVLIVFFQNQKILNLSRIYPKSQVVILERINIGALKGKHDTLRQAFLGIPGVVAATYSSTVPFAETDQKQTVSRSPVLRGEGQNGAIQMHMVAVDEAFMQVFNMPMSAGRAFRPNSPEDRFRPESSQTNVIINQSAAQALGFLNDAEAIGQTFYSLPEARHPTPRRYHIIGVRPDQHFLGLHTKSQPVTFLIRPDAWRLLALLMDGSRSTQTQRRIDAVWQQHAPGYPIQKLMLEDVFNMFYHILTGINGVLLLLAAVALALPLVGLFGLAAFNTQTRAREIGIRKVMGAEVHQIAGLLMWQFSKPVLWSLPLAALPAYWAAKTYLSLFPERIDLVIPLILGAGVLCLICAQAVVFGQVIMAAKAPPVKALRRQ